MAVRTWKTTVASGGFWSTAANWVEGVVPTSADDVIIAGVPTVSVSMSGTVTSFTSAQIVVNITSISGSGTFSSWSISTPTCSNIISTSSITVGTGSKTFLFNTLQPFVVGQTVDIINTYTIAAGSGFAGYAGNVVVASDAKIMLDTFTGNVNIQKDLTVDGLLNTLRSDAGITFTGTNPSTFIPGPGNYGFIGVSKTNLANTFNLSGSLNITQTTTSKFTFTSGTAYLNGNTINVAYFNNTTSTTTRTLDMGGSTVYCGIPGSSVTNAIFATSVNGSYINRGVFIPAVGGIMTCHTTATLDRHPNITIPSGIGASVSGYVYDLLIDNGTIRNSTPVIPSNSLSINEGGIDTSSIGYELSNSLTTTTGSKSLTVATNLAFAANDPIRLFPAGNNGTGPYRNTENYLIGTVTSYNATTGALVLNITTVIGATGLTYTYWWIATAITTGSGATTQILYLPTGLNYKAGLTLLLAPSENSFNDLPSGVDTGWYIHGQISSYNSDNGRLALSLSSTSNQKLIKTFSSWNIYVQSTQGRLQLYVPTNSPGPYQYSSGHRWANVTFTTGLGTGANATTWNIDYCRANSITVNSTTGNNGIFNWNDVIFGEVPSDLNTMSIMSTGCTHDLNNVTSIKNDSSLSCGGTGSKFYLSNSSITSIAGTLTIGTGKYYLQQDVYARAMSAPVSFTSPLTSEAFFQNNWLYIRDVGETPASISASGSGLGTDVDSTITGGVSIIAGIETTISQYLPIVTNTALSFTLPINLNYNANSNIAITLDKDNFMTGTLTSYNPSTGATVANITAVKGGESTIGVTSIVVGEIYSIISLGTTTQTQWNNIAGTTGVTYTAGSVFTATATTTGTGTISKAYNDMRFILSGSYILGANILRNYVFRISYNVFGGTITGRCGDLFVSSGCGPVTNGSVNFLRGDFMHDGNPLVNQLGLVSQHGDGTPYVFNYLDNFTNGGEDWRFYELGAVSTTQVVTIYGACKTGSISQYDNAANLMLNISDVFTCSARGQNVNLIQIRTIPNTTRYNLVLNGLSGTGVQYASLYNRGIFNFYDVDLHNGVRINNGGIFEILQDITVGGWYLTDTTYGGTRAHRFYDTWIGVRGNAPNFAATVDIQPQGSSGYDYGYSFSRLGPLGLGGVRIFDSPTTHFSNFSSTTSSTSINTILGSKTLTVASGLGWVAAQMVVVTDLYDLGIKLAGSITSYDNNTGVLVVNITESSGESTNIFDSWNIKQGLTIGTGSKTVKMQPGLAQVLGSKSNTTAFNPFTNSGTQKNSMILRVNPTVYMYGTYTSYNNTTGDLVVNISGSSSGFLGSGTYSDFEVYLGALVQAGYVTNSNYTNTMMIDYYHRGGVLYGDIADFILNEQAGPIDPAWATDTYGDIIFNSSFVRLEGLYLNWRKTGVTIFNCLDQYFSNGTKFYNLTYTPSDNISIYGGFETLWYLSTAVSYTHNFVEVYGNTILTTSTGAPPQTFNLTNINTTSNLEIGNKNIYNFYGDINVGALYSYSGTSGSASANRSFTLNLFNSIYCDLINSAAGSASYPKTINFNNNKIYVKGTANYLGPAITITDGISYITDSTGGYVILDESYTFTNIISSNSTTTITSGTGTKNFTILTDLSIAAGNYLKIIDNNNISTVMTGTVTSYNVSTGALAVNVTSASNTGNTSSDWYIEFGVNVGITGSQTVYVAKNLSYTATTSITLSLNSDNYVTGTITSYSKTTGALVINITTTKGSGIYSGLKVSLNGTINTGSGWVNTSYMPNIEYNTLSGTLIGQCRDLTIAAECGPTVNQANVLQLHQNFIGVDAKQNLTFLNLTLSSDGDINFDNWNDYVNYGNRFFRLSVPSTWTSGTTANISSAAGYFTPSRANITYNLNNLHLNSTTNQPLNLTVAATYNFNNVIVEGVTGTNLTIATNAVVNFGYVNLSGIISLTNTCTINAFTSEPEMLNFTTSGSTTTKTINTDQYWVIKDVGASTGSISITNDANLIANWNGGGWRIKCTGNLDFSTVTTAGQRASVIFDMPTGNTKTIPAAITAGGVVENVIFNNGPPGILNGNLNIYGNVSGNILGSLTGADFTFLNPSTTQTISAISTSITSRSTSSITNTTGSKTFIVETPYYNSLYGNGMPIYIGVIGSPSVTMTGTVTSFSTTTGTLVVNISSVTGTGTYTNWAIRTELNTTTSSTSLTTDIGTKTLTVATGLNYVANQTIDLLDLSNQVKLTGTIISYNSVTGLLTTNITSSTDTTVSSQTWSIEPKQLYIETMIVNGLDTTVDINSGVSTNTLTMTSGNVNINSSSTVRAISTTAALNHNGGSINIATGATLAVYSYLRTTTTTAANLTLNGNMEFPYNTSTSTRFNVPSAVNYTVSGDGWVIYRSAGLFNYGGTTAGNIDTITGDNTFNLKLLQVLGASQTLSLRAVKNFTNHESVTDIFGRWAANTASFNLPVFGDFSVYSSASPTTAITTNFKLLQPYISGTDSSKIHSWGTTLYAGTPIQWTNIRMNSAGKLRALHSLETAGTFYHNNGTVETYSTNILCNTYAFTEAGGVTGTRTIEFAGSGNYIQSTAIWSFSDLSFLTCTGTYYNSSLATYGHIRIPVTTTGTVAVSGSVARSNTPPNYKFMGTTQKLTSPFYANMLEFTSNNLNTNTEVYVSGQEVNLINQNGVNAAWPTGTNIKLNGIQSTIINLTGNATAPNITIMDPGIGNTKVVIINPDLSTNFSNITTEARTTLTSSIPIISTNINISGTLTIGGSWLIPVDQAYNFTGSNSVLSTTNASSVIDNGVLYFPSILYTEASLGSHTINKIVRNTTSTNTLTINGVSGTIINIIENSINGGGRFNFTSTGTSIVFNNFNIAGKVLASTYINGNVNSSGNIFSVNNAVIKNSTASPSNSWYGGINTLDDGGNTGWSFSTVSIVQPQSDDYFLLFL